MGINVFKIINIDSYNVGYFCFLINHFPRCYIFLRTSRILDFGHPEGA